MSLVIMLHLCLRKRFVCLRVQIRTNSKSAEGQCIWYGQKADSTSGKIDNKEYHGPAKKLTDPGGLDILKQFCPSIYNGTGKCRFLAWFLQVARSLLNQ